METTKYHMVLSITVDCLLQLSLIRCIRNYNSNCDNYNYPCASPLPLWTVKMNEQKTSGIHSKEFF